VRTLFSLIRWEVARRHRSTSDGGMRPPADRRSADSAIHRRTVTKVRRRLFRNHSRRPVFICTARSLAKILSNSRERKTRLETHGTSMRLKVNARLVPATFRVTRGRSGIERASSSIRRITSSSGFFIRGDRDATCHVLRGRKYLRSTRSGTSYKAKMPTRACMYIYIYIHILYTAHVRS